MPVDGNGGLVAGEKTRYFQIKITLGVEQDG
jgi:hypothetical protein